MKQVASPEEPTDVAEAVRLLGGSADQALRAISLIDAAAARNDAELSSKGLSGANVSELFDFWVNVLPGQGSRTIRTEEAVWLGLMGLRRVVEENTG